MNLPLNLNNMWLYFIGFIITALIVFDVVVIAQSKKSHYELWKREFERLCGDLVDDVIIRDLYDQTMSPKEAVEIYKELKEKV